MKKLTCLCMKHRVRVMLTLAKEFGGLNQGRTYLGGSSIFCVPDQLRW